eukprot:SAG22_NODE_4680_length_1193_cov_1.923218_1_plen_194_part_10
MSLNHTHSSLEEVFIASRGQLVRVARRILRNPELADDAVQDTYLRVAEMRSDAEIARPAAYWTRAVCNMALDYLRRQERENSYRTHGVDVETLEIPDSRSPERLLFESQAIRMIDQALDEVPPKTRETFELYRIKGLTPARWLFFVCRLQQQAAALPSLFLPAHPALRCPRAALGASPVRHDPGPSSMARESHG